MQSRRVTYMGYGACALAGCLWGTGFYFGRLALDEMSVESMVLYRFLFASLGMLPVALLHRVRLTRSEVGILLISTAFGIPIQFLLQFHGLALTTVSHASLMVGSMPVLLAAAAAIFAGERLDWLGWAALTGSTIGVALIELGGRRGPATRGEPTLAGDLLVVASLVTALAITGRSGGRPEISAIIVPAGTPGLTVGPEYSKVGWCASDTRELAFSSCRVPGENLLGDQGRGYAQFLRTLDEGRVAIAALSAGLAAGCVDECLAYVSQRAAFGHRLGYYQGIQFKIADMEARAYGARLAWYDAAARLVAAEPFKKQAAIAKLTCSNAAMDNARDATQIFGGYGFMNEFPVARFYRDAKVLEIGEGTSEVQRMVIARELGIDGA